MIRETSKSRKRPRIKCLQSRILYLVSFLALLVFFVSFFEGCGRSRKYRPPTPTQEQPKPPSQPPRPEPPLVPPESVKIFLRVKDWVIQDHRVLNWSPKYGQLYFSGRFILAEDLVFKFISEKLPDYYWLAKIPSQKEGGFTIYAKRYNETLSVEPLADPPKRFDIVMKVVGGRVLNQFIKDQNPKWGRFRVDRIEKKTLYLRNDWYRGSQWAARLPKGDGTWTIHLVLLGEKR